MDQRRLCPPIDEVSTFYYYKWRIVVIFLKEHENIGNKTNLNIIYAMKQ